MSNNIDHKVLSHLEEHEGSLHYTDGARTGVRTFGALMFVLYQDERGNLATGWNESGYIPAAMEAIASYYATHPGFKEAVDGMYEFIKQKQGRGSR